MNADAQLRSLKYKTAAVVMGIALCIGAVPWLCITGWVLVGIVQIRAKRHMLIHDVDHIAVRDAARLFLANSEKDTYVPSAQLPDAIRELDPVRGSVDHRGFLFVEFGGGFHHHGLLIVPEGAEDAVRNHEVAGKYTLLREGIWYYEDTD